MDLDHAEPDDSPPSDEGNPQDSSPGVPEGKHNVSQRKGNARKRTKTGCLTCRRRRIKCDEGKPTCNNCIKSKRECEGYNQRLTFKEPLGAFNHGPLFGHPFYHSQHHGLNASVGSQPAGAQPKASSSQGPLPTIAPKPPPLDFTAGLTFQHTQAYRSPGEASTTATALSFSPTQFSPQFSEPASSRLPPHSTPTFAKPHPGSDNVFKIPATPSKVAQSAGNDLLQASALLHEPAPLTPSTPDSRSRPTINDESKTAHVTAPEEEYWHSDDEASMADSDDDMVATENRQAADLKSNDLGIQVARRLDAPFDFYGSQPRTFTGFVNADNVLATYTPSSKTSPLNDTQTAAVFWYFVNVTGPSMSLYERHPFDPSPVFQGRPVPKSRQHIWTYTFPIISLSHPALLQAMLALGSLQMAKLQGIPSTASMKHYHLSLRRIAKNYRSFQRRTQLATLAATLLLGFYEVWNSEHDKWCRHMWGARAILKELPLRDMTIEALQRRRGHRQSLYMTHDTLQHDDFVRAEMEPDMLDINTTLMSQLTGQVVTYEDGGYVSGNEHRHIPRLTTDRDVESFEHLSDLYWWYCKMDVYQSFLGGTRLFMEYELWTQCAPRGPCGRIDAIYGTFDHLILLMGRLASFASLDLARKRLALKADMKGKGPGQQSPPMFPGLLPSKGEFTIPTGFSPPREDAPQSNNMDNLDLDASTAAAMQEWNNIRQAFEVFRANLGPDFDALGPELETPQPTPFGPARTYRTYSIAGVWMNYYMGLVVLYRSHPSMPPVAMIAAGKAAQQTGPLANEIGRIAAGLSGDTSAMTAVTTVAGAAFIESAFSLFVAGVQCQDTAQRHWLIKRLHEIARLTGWQSAKQIAEGCESAWTKAAQMGRGAPYQRPPELDKLAPAVVGKNPRRLDRKMSELAGAERRFVLSKSEQAHYALGLLSVEQDLERLELRERG